MFGIRENISIGTMKVNTPVGVITFHVVEAKAPFLLCLRDVDDMKLLFDNLNNTLIKCEKKAPIIRKFGHPFVLLDHVESTLVDSYFNQSEILEYHLTEL